VLVVLVEPVTVRVVGFQSLVGLVTLGVHEPEAVGVGSAQVLLSVHAQHQVAEAVLAHTVICS
jgi:hypothetical protein